MAMSIELDVCVCGLPSGFIKWFYRVILHIRFIFIMQTEAIYCLEKTLGYTFIDRARLIMAITHRSCRGNNNERLEFLGDAILSFVIAEYLFDRFPAAKEGQLTRLRSRIVKGVTLAEIARELNIGDYLNLGSGELKSGGFRRQSILADAMEAIIGAVYLDGGMVSCKKAIYKCFGNRLENLNFGDGEDKDGKTLLQEYLQSRKKSLPVYEMVAMEGQSHELTFVVKCWVSDVECQIGKGASRRLAEQNAAVHTLAVLGVKSNG